LEGQLKKDREEQGRMVKSATKWKMQFIEIQG
jgi:hypothetical protein